jgi:serine protease inhibitor
MVKSRQRLRVVLCALALNVIMSPLATIRVEAAPAASTEPDKGKVHLAQEAARVANDIGIRTFVRLESVKHGDNSLISPVSLGIACALLADGCHGATRNMVAKAMSPTASLPSQAAWNALCTSLLSPCKGVQQQLGTAIFADQGVTFVPAFVQQAKNAFQADCKAVSMGSPSATALIDQWVAAHTKGRISSSLSHLSPEDVLLLSALYFKGEWTDKFQTSDTHPSDFTLTSGKQKNSSLRATSCTDWTIAHADHVHHPAQEERWLTLAVSQAFCRPDRAMDRQT